MLKRPSETIKRIGASLIPRTGFVPTVMGFELDDIVQLVDGPGDLFVPGLQSQTKSQDWYISYTHHQRDDDDQGLVNKTFGPTGQQ